MTPFSFLFALLLYVLTVGARALGSHSSPILPRAGSLEQVTNFGDNPSNVAMYIYVPTNLATNPSIIVAIHYCTGTAEAYFTGSPYATLAEQYGFIVIYPESPYEGKCWDVSSQATLTHNGGGNSNSIANMVTWTIEQYNADSSKVFVTGSSSGAMMTNVMAATYPELFAAGIAYSGVAAGCFMSAANQVDAWNSSCSQGQVIATPEVWAGVAEAMFPGYNGPRPKMQIYHGSVDEALYPQNYNETCKQWAGVFGYDYGAPHTVVENTPEANYETTTWGDKLQGIYATGVGHTVPIHGDQDMIWFGPYRPIPSTTPNPTHIERRSSPEDHGSGWSNLWETGEDNLWDRGLPSPALIDLIEQQQQSPTSLFNPFTADGQRKKALVPGCGRGYDVVMLALHGFDASGLEISAKAVSEAEAYAASAMSQPQAYNFGAGYQAENSSPGSVNFMQGDFFQPDWSGDEKYDLVYDYTFLCALHPSMRRDWAMRMASLVSTGGLLVCLEFPMYKDLGLPGPPWGLKGVHWDLLARGGDGLLTDNVGERETDTQGQFQRVLYVKPERTYEVGKGTDMLSVYMRKEVGRLWGTEE
ncbi:uncharacterized protein CDV56_108851 [Aspergillus thermomutatus]|uniref:Carboxylic ester hydrolase n=1 Tax=Aspergillus thermomutatus TaxID=41047 RepID=A0A397HMA5_ASPTH|nr:uncharacterized protein CDV56_108851 [Aspergillus thermomutatus]RHZ61550.1 hypothetical protein CDV56_108851 [Aspergillus thermomutatus]